MSDVNGLIRNYLAEDRRKREPRESRKKMDADMAQLIKKKDEQERAEREKERQRLIYEFEKEGIDWRLNDELVKGIDDKTEGNCINPETMCNGGDAKPRNNGYGKRDKEAIELVKQRPEMITMRPGVIKKELQAKSTLFLSGYNDWWRENPIFPKGKGGRNPK
jgi:hypothetical protein